MFGTLPSPCGPGNAKGATDQGVTDTSIRIGYGDDRGFPQQPGLDQEMGEAVTALIKWCNSQGGINGRQIAGDDYDAAITQVNTVMQQACKSDFMLVGEGFALDEAAESTRLGCNLPEVAGYTVGPDVANSPEMYQAVPNPVDYLPASPYYEATKLFPQAVQAFDVIHTTLASATEVSYAKDVSAAAAAGWKQLNCGVTINYTGEPSYTPFAQRFQTCGVKLIYNNITPGPQLFGMMQALYQLGVKPIYIMETSDYTTPFAQWNTSGIGNDVYVRDAFVPLEEANINPAVQKYVSLVTADGGKISRVFVPVVGDRSEGLRFHPDPPVHDQRAVQGAQLDRRRTSRPDRPSRQYSAQLRNALEADRIDLVAVLSPDPGPVRLQQQVPLQGAAIGVGHHPQLGPDRHEVPLVQCHQTAVDSRL
jgi:hypothetical protein